MTGSATAGRRTRKLPPANGSPLADPVLRLIWEEQEISRAEIARRLGLSRSTVSEIVSGLLPTGLVAEMGVGPSRGGRPPIVLRFQDDACVILGVEMGGAHVAAVLTDLRGRIIRSAERNHPVRNDPEGTRKLVLELCEACLAPEATAESRLVGIGVAVPSPLDPRHPDRLSELVLPAWKGKAGLDLLRERFGVPVLVDNDANLGALAEGWWGAGRGVDHFAYVKIATGVGSGHVIGGRIYRGATGVAGEIGHMAIDPSGGKCICGLRGCLATFVGAQALVQRARMLLPEYPDSPLGSRSLSIRTIEDAALAGDRLACELVQEAAEYLGIAVAGLLNLMNPSLVIVGGELARLGDLLLAPLRETAERRTLVSSVAACEVKAEELGSSAIAVGAATLILEAALSQPRMFPATAAS